MSDTPFIKFFPEDFLAGTSGLSPSERGVYITLLCLMWDQGGPVELDAGRLARRCGMPKAAFNKTLAALLKEKKLRQMDDGRLTNKRAEEVLQDRLDRIQKGAHGANSRWQREPTAIYPDRTPDDLTDRDRVVIAMGFQPGDMVPGGGKVIGGEMDMVQLDKWRDELGLSIDQIEGVVSEIVANRPAGDPITSFRYFTNAMRRLAGMKGEKMKPIANGGSDGRTGQRQERSQRAVAAAAEGTTGDDYG